MDELKTRSLFLKKNGSLLYDEIIEFEYPWLIISHIEEMILRVASKLPKEKYTQEHKGVWIAKNAKISGDVCINAPCIIDEGAEVRHCAYIRGNVLVGKGAVVGNSTELKNCILFDGVQVPHYNYVGDSVLGYGAHLGAGAVISNVKGDKTPVKIHSKSEIIDTGLRKFGAILGDGVEIGCGTVLNPGTVIGVGTRVYPLCSVRGCVPSDSIYKSEGNTVRRRA